MYDTSTFTFPVSMLLLVVDDASLFSWPVSAKLDVVEDSWPPLLTPTVVLLLSDVIPNDVLSDSLNEGVTSIADFVDRSSM